MVKNRKTKYLQIKYKKRRVKLLIDRILIFRLIRQLHGRFWGIAAVSGLSLGLFVCFLIRPDMLRIDTAFSDFGNDVRTAPYFAGTMFFAAYGLWRWRNYVIRTLKHSSQYYYLLTFTILGLYTVALMPVSWQPWPYRLHLVGFGVAGVSIALTVLLDGLMSKTRKTKHTRTWQLIRATSFLLILAGGILTFGSVPAIGWYDVTLLGEIMMLTGYSLWIYFKTFLGEGAYSKISILIRKAGLVR